MPFQKGNNKANNTKPAVKTQAEAIEEFPIEPKVLMDEIPQVAYFTPKRTTRKVGRNIADGEERVLFLSTIKNLQFMVGPDIQIQFQNFGYETSDPDEIKYIREAIQYTAAKAEVFEKSYPAWAIEKLKDLNQYLHEHPEEPVEAE